MQLDPEHCSLEGYLIPCHGRLQRGHLMNKSKARGNKAVREYLSHDMNLSPQCVAHNVGRVADSYDHGWSDVKDYYDGVPWKIHKVEFELERMLE